MSFKLDWNRLLSAERPGLSAEKKKTTGAEGRSPFEADHDRVIFSAPFRRLAGKTQVHPFAQVDHVHNRLTHTLEVASVGRSLGMNVARWLRERGEMPEGRSDADLMFIVQAACLAHDMGNPPFGHAGEYAIRVWAKEHLGDIFPKKQHSVELKAALNDWRWFEGNAQSLRLVSRPDKDERDYFRFTYASLGAMVKYPWTAGDARTRTKGKHNVFFSEEKIFSEANKALGLKKPGGKIARHPLSFLSEAADDICYRISDLEDAVEMGILREAEVREIFGKIIGGEDKGGRLSALRAAAVGRLIQAMTGVFTQKENYAAIMRGEREDDLKASLPAEMREAMGTIKKRYEEIFVHRRKVAFELGAHSILARLLEGYALAVRELAERGYDEMGFAHQRLLALSWDQAFIRHNADRGAAWWLGRAMDHVSGMTDAHATQVARELAGG